MAVWSRMMTVWSRMMTVGSRTGELPATCEVEEEERECEVKKEVVAILCWLFNIAATYKVHNYEGRIFRIVCASTPRQKFQVRLSTAQEVVAILCWLLNIPATYEVHIRAESLESCTRFHTEIEVTGVIFYHTVSAHWRRAYTVRRMPGYGLGPRFRHSKVPTSHYSDKSVQYSDVARFRRSTVVTSQSSAKSFCFSIPAERDRLSNDSSVGISRHLNLSESRYSSTKLD